jgi:hypothetical protein
MAKIAYHISELGHDVVFNVHETSTSINVAPGLSD